MGFTAFLLIFTSFPSRLQLRRGRIAAFKTPDSSVGQRRRLGLVGIAKKKMAINAAWKKIGLQSENWPWQIYAQFGSSFIIYPVNFYGNPLNGLLVGNAYRKNISPVLSHSVRTAISEAFFIYSAAGLKWLALLDRKRALICGSFTEENKNPSAKAEKHCKFFKLPCSRVVLHEI